MVTNNQLEQKQPAVTGEQVVEVLQEIADLLESQSANRFRVSAYRKAAETVRAQKRPIDDVYEAEGIEGLMALPGIGESLARAIEQLLHTGHLPLLERLRGAYQPERAFASVANIGPRLAHRIHQQLGIETLAELETVAHDGRLAQVPGMGRKRLRAVRESLAGRFRTQRRTAVAQQRDETVPVSELLDVDEEYRRLARAGRLRKIAPRRFNPTAEAWLPILHTERGERHYTALYSNTARAHELGTTHDWVVIYRDDEDDGQWTVITSGLGKMRGKRIVCGRERECAAYYGGT